MTVIPYRRDRAVNYARRWALRRNPEYYDYELIGGDCTNFASQCVYAGSGVMNYTPTYGWYYIDANDKAPAWTGVRYFYDFMTTNDAEGPFGEEVPLEMLEPGDLIQIGNRDNGYTHTLVLVEVRRSFFGEFYYICAHSNDALFRRLDSYIYTQRRCIHINGVRTNV